MRPEATRPPRHPDADWRLTRRRTLRLLGAGTAGLGLAAGRSEARAAPFSDEAIRELDRQIHRIRRRFGLRRAIGVHVEHLESGVTLFSHNPDRAYVPASGQKLPIMGACLHYLGPNYRFSTRFLVEAPPTPDGVIEGPVLIRGSGDPSLNRHGMDFIADSLAAYGITAIRGEIILDDSFFTPEETDQRLVARRIRYDEPILSALGYHWNKVEVAGLPELEGERPKLRDEGYGYFAIQNRTVLRNSGRPYILAHRRPNRRVRIEGRIRADGEERVTRFTATEPALYFGYAFRGKLIERGVNVPGLPRRRTPSDPDLPLLLYRHDSDPMARVVESPGKYSNNWSAEQLLFAVGAHRWGPPGTREKGVRAVEEYLVGLGNPSGSFTIDDGSGLSRRNRLTPRQLVTVVRDLYGQPELRHDFLESLAHSGISGTLERRMRADALRGRVIAKTGSLAGVSSLSGVAFPSDGPSGDPSGAPSGGDERALAFAVITNGLRTQWSGDAVENEIAAALVEWGGAT